MENFERLCESVFTLDRAIRYVSVIGKEGVSLAGGYRNDKIPRYYTDHELDELEEFYNIIRKVAEFHKPRIGNLNCAILEFDKVRWWTRNTTRADRLWVTLIINKILLPYYCGAR